MKIPVFPVDAAEQGGVVKGKEEVIYVKKSYAGVGARVINTKREDLLFLKNGKSKR